MAARGLVISTIKSTSLGYISLNKDDIVKIISIHTEGYYHVETLGGSGGQKKGWIKKDIIIIGKSFIPTANYTASSDDELSLTSGTRIFGFTTEEEWWFGCTQSGKQGYFPGTFVDAPEPSPSIPRAPSTPSPTAKDGGGDARKSPPPLPRKSAPPVPPTRSKPTSSHFENSNPMQEASLKQAESKGKGNVTVSMPSPASAPAPAPAPAPSPGSARSFKGTHPLQFLLWANNMALASSIWMVIFGIFTALWSTPKHYGCEIGGVSINSIYLAPLNAANTSVVCNPEEELPDLNGDMTVGLLSVLVGALIFAFEGFSLDDKMWGCYYPSDSFSYKNNISIRGVLYVLLSFPFFARFPSALSASFLLPTGMVCLYGVYRGEAGDNGRASRAKRKAQAVARGGGGAKRGPQGGTENSTGWNPLKIYRKLVDENKFAIYVWVFLYFFSNALTFFYTLSIWVGRVKEVEQGLLDGTLDTLCDSDACALNRVVVTKGGISGWGPYAKACGMCLNFNCSLIIYPVVKILLRRLNNIGVSFSNQTANPTIFARFFASPVTRLIPLSKNIDFHKLVAKTMGGFAAAHTIFHFFNYRHASDATLTVFRKWGWGGTAYFTGSLICFSMFFIFTAASDTVRRAHYEIFFSAHHWFVVYFACLLMHGPIYWKWAFVPLSMYLLERVMQERRGDRPYYVNKVEWIEPVMAIQFRPAFKQDFVFREGQYLYLNCPYINKNEWHPFTISSASGDLATGPRISLETGEEVREVPRPAGISKSEKWSKYCPVGVDYTKVKPSQYLNKHETGYNDFVSVHIKVHGLELKEAKSWTRKLKEYFELMNPKEKFPLYLTHRDERGDTIVGRQLGPDGQQILRVDGPHSAPAEHYANYGTVMVIGAGIGLTPCASVLTSMLRYKWKKNYQPEILHFYWMVRQSDIDSFQWLIHLITDLEHGLKNAREQNQIGPRYYCEINIYITGVGKEKVKVPALRTKENSYQGSKTKPGFMASKLYGAMLNPAESSKKQVEIQNGQESRNAKNRMQDVWVWSSRPDWNKIFEQNKRQRQHESIGVCFCGAPVIGKDLMKNCQKYSSKEEDIVFDLMKENF